MDPKVNANIVSMDAHKEALEQIMIHKRSIDEV